MRLLTSQRRTPIGIDVGRRRIKAVQMSRLASGGRAVATVASIARPADAQAAMLSADEAWRLAAVLERRGFVGNEVVLAAAPGQVVQSLLELPPMANAAVPLSSLVRNELCASQRLDAAAVEIAHWEVPPPARGGRATFVMAAAHRHADAEAAVETFAAAGLDVAAVDLNVWALARGCAAAAAESHGALVPIVDLGWGAASLVMLLRGTVVFHRTVDEGGLATLVSAAAQATRLRPEVVGQLFDHAEMTLAQSAAGSTGDRRSPELSAELLGELRDAVRGHCERLAEEVHASISYLTQRYPDAAPSQALLVGGGAMLPGVADALRATLGLECHPIAPANGTPALTLAAGLAMHETARPAATQPA